FFRRRMQRRSFLKTLGTAGLAAGFMPAEGIAYAASQPASGPVSAKKHTSPETILLKDYRPKSIYKIPITEVAKAKFPIIDMHSHAYAKTSAEIATWVRNMDEV